MRKFLVCIVAQIVLLTGIGYGQAGTTVEPPNDPQTLLKAAAQYYDYDSYNMKPWHLKASYQFYDLKGNPAEQGKWEFWWVSPKIQHSVLTRNNITQSEWSTVDGVFRKQDGGSLRYFERNISQALLVSLPSEKMIDSGRMKLELKMAPVGQMQLACVNATLQWENNGKPKGLPSGIYCFNPSTLFLQSLNQNSTLYEYDQLVKTQNRYLAKQVAVMIGDHKVFTITIDTIDEITPEGSALTRPADAILVSEPVRENSYTKNEGGVSFGSEGGVMFGSLVKKAPPVYPNLAKIAHIQGTVVLAAVIGKDGKDSRFGNVGFAVKTFS